VLSEIPAEWYRAIRSWHGLNRSRTAEINGETVPSMAEEYLFYQTLTGVWPLHEPTLAERQELTARLRAYMRKALREAKQHSSWINPNPRYEDAVDHFVCATLDTAPENQFPCEVSQFVGRIKLAGLWNSLSQVLLKVASPGVPDFYQGSELWDFSLVDPDNRRPVDYTRRCRLLSTVRDMQSQGAPALLEQITKNPSDGLVKLYVTSSALAFRKSHGDLVTEGSYIPLRAAGSCQKHAVAFARTLGPRCLIAAAGRFFMELGRNRNPTGEAWGESVLLIRRDCVRPAYRDVFSCRTIETVHRNGKHVLPLAEVFAHLPVAWLEGVD